MDGIRQQELVHRTMLTPIYTEMKVHSIPGALKRTITAFVLRGVAGACLIASAAFIHLLGRGELIEGYLVREKCRDYYFRHYWARVDGVDYDVGAAITRRLAPQTKLLGKDVLVVLAPLGGEQLDDPRELSILEHGYRTYQKKPSALMRRSPQWMRDEFGF
jgi:hypothetical protein